jgi:hypothetical protein
MKRFLAHRSLSRSDDKIDELFGQPELDPGKEALRFRNPLVEPSQAPLMEGSPEPSCKAWFRPSAAQLTAAASTALGGITGAERLDQEHRLTTRLPQAPSLRWPRNLSRIAGKRCIGAIVFERSPLFTLKQCHWVSGIARKGHHGKLIDQVANAIP